MASTPSTATRRSICGSASRKASFVNRTSPGLSSTSSTTLFMVSSNILSLLRQFRFGQPECVDASHKAVEGVPVRRLSKVAVRLQLIADHDIRLVIRCRQDDRRNYLQVLIFFDQSQNLPAIHFGQVEIEQNEIGPRRICVDALASQKGHGFDAVGSEMQPDRLAV